MFSSHTTWNRSPNALTLLRDRMLNDGISICDLTVSNPTTCDFAYPEQDILHALADPEVLRYQPEPRGLRVAREAVAAYYSSRDGSFSPSDIILTSGTSEAYGMLFSLLCNPGECVAVPTPSYPLFEFLANLQHVQLASYRLLYDGEWHIDLDSVRDCLGAGARAVVLIHPNNPTGSFVRQDELAAIQEMAAAHHAAVIIDEVFSEFPLDGQTHTARLQNPSVSTFTLNGISKLAGLPQMKVGWIVVNGHKKEEALARLELVADTYLSVGTPVQRALPILLQLAPGIRAQIAERTRRNLSVLDTLLRASPACSRLHIEGGWTAIVRVPMTRTDEEWATAILTECRVLVYPGFFFDLEGPCHLVLSLIPSPEDFSHGVSRMRSFVQQTI